MQNTDGAAVASLADNAAGDRSRSPKPHANQKLKKPEIDMCSVKQFLACRGFRVRYEISRMLIVCSHCVSLLRNLFFH